MSDAGRGGRNRSRSPRRDRAPRRDTRYRSRSPMRRDEHAGNRNERVRDDRPRDDRRGREPPRGPRSNASAARPAPKGSSGVKARAASPEETVPDVEMAEARQKPEGMDDDTWEMMKVMGFAGFKSTKNTKVPGNANNFGIRRDKQMEARQYMNRQGGFNRPLSPGRV